MTKRSYTVEFIIHAVVTADEDGEALSIAEDLLPKLPGGFSVDSSDVIDEGPLDE